MNKVVGIGGVFIKSENPDALREWYQRHLGMSLEDWGGVVFRPGSDSESERDEATVWSVFDSSSEYFSPSPARFMINYRVNDLDAVLEALRIEGCEVDDQTETSELGKFGWVMDPDGNRVELWEPPAKA